MPDIIDNVKVGEHIKRLLKKHQMTQDDLAEALSISKSAVSQNLRGKSTFDIQNLIQIAKLFEITLDELLNLKTSESDDVVSEYQKVVKKGINAINNVPAQDLIIDEPDLYGKVLIDYVIEQRDLTMFTYLHEAKVQFVPDYYHRAKDIYLKVIRYMLEEDKTDIFDYILKYTELTGSFQIDDPEMSMVIWGLLDKPNLQDFTKDFIQYKPTLKARFLRFNQEKEHIPLTKTDVIENIAKFKLKNVLNSFMQIKQRDEDLLYITNKFIEHGFIDGIHLYIDYYYKGEISWVRKVSQDVQKAYFAILRLDDFDLAIKFAEKGLYTDLTPIVRETILKEQLKVTSHLIAKYPDVLNFKKIGESCVQMSNIKLLNDIIHHFSKDDLNYLISFVKLDDTETLLYLIKKGARIDEKYYNLETFKKVNQLIDHLVNKGGESL